MKETILFLIIVDVYMELQHSFEFQYCYFTKTEQIVIFLAELWGKIRILIKTLSESIYY